MYGSAVVFVHPEFLMTVPGFRMTSTLHNITVSCCIVVAICKLLYRLLLIAVLMTSLL